MSAVISPQLMAVGETNRNTTETSQNTKQKQSYADQIQQKNSATILSKIDLNPVQVIHGEPTVEFTIEEVNDFTIEEGLHQAVILKFSYGKPDLQELRQMIPKQLDIKGYCNVGQLEFRHILVRFDLFDDFVHCLSRTTGIVKSKGDEFFFRTFPWTMGFNPHEETSKAVVWISFPDLPANLFAKKSLMSIASAVGKPLAVDKATQDRTRPSTARVKVLIDLLDKHPRRIKIKIVDKFSGRIVAHYQQVVFDNLPKFCTCCKHQGHEEKVCRWRIEQSNDEADRVVEQEELGNLDKLAGDARDFLNAKRAGQLEDESGEQQALQSGIEIFPAAKEIPIGTNDANTIQHTTDASTIRNTMQGATHDDDEAQILVGKDSDDWKMVHARKSPTMKGVSPSQKYEGFQQIASNKPSSSNYFEAMVAVEDGVPVAAATNSKDRDDQTVVKQVGHLDHVGQNRQIIDVMGPSAHGEIDNVQQIIVSEALPTLKNIVNNVGHGEHVNEQKQSSKMLHAGKDSIIESTLGSTIVGSMKESTGYTTVENEQNEGNDMESISCEIKNGQNKGIHDELSRVSEKPAGMKTLKVGNIDLVRDMGQWGRPLERIGKDAGHLGISCRQFEQKEGDDKESIFKIIEGSCTNEVVGQKTISENTNAGNGMQHVTLQEKDKDMGHNVENGKDLKVGVFDSLKIKDGGHLNLAFERKASTFEKVVAKDTFAGQQFNIDVCFSKLSEGNFDKLINKDVGPRESDTQLIHSGELSTLEKNQKDVGHLDHENEQKKPHGEGSQVEQNADKAALELLPVQAHSSSVPTLYFLNPQVEQIINDAHNEMTRNTPIFKQPLVTLNTSVFEVPSQSAESIGDFEGASGQHLVSTGNNNEIAMISTGNKNEVHEKQESARKLSYSDCKALTSSKRRQIPMRAAKQKGIASSTSTRSDKSNKK